MFINKKLTLAASLALAGALSVPAFGQYRDHNRNGYNQNSSAYQQGYREGIEDRNHGNRVAHNHTWKNNDDAQAYAAGYSAGYNNGSAAANNGWGRDRDWDRNRRNGYGNNGYPTGAYGANGYGNAGRQAQQVGYQDGLNDGRKDRSTGHSFRPTEGDNYKDADRGYSSSFGDKQAYKDTYRRGYEQGYQQGYNGGYGYRR
ncbi:MAG TPA: hypothetical protein VG897_02190 [Terriglobales bacterium]|nr:hypothetical protein [Terriglobales bacterium]